MRSLPFTNIRLNKLYSVNEDEMNKKNLTLLSPIILTFLIITNESSKFESQNIMNFEQFHYKFNQNMPLL